MHYNEFICFLGPRGIWWRRFFQVYPRPLPGRNPGGHFWSTFGIVKRFGEPFWVSCCTILCFFRGLNFSRVLDPFGGGGGKRGRRQFWVTQSFFEVSKNLKKMKMFASRSAPPSGGRRILRASPTAAGPFFGATAGWLTGC